MPADPESQNWLMGIIAAMGAATGSGGTMWKLGTKQSADSERIRNLEKSHERMAKTVESTHTTVTGLSITTADTKAEVTAIRNMLENFRR